jgi:hypothetical protein
VPVDTLKILDNADNVNFDGFEPQNEDHEVPSDTSITELVTAAPWRRLPVCA